MELPLFMCENEKASKRKGQRTGSDRENERERERDDLQLVILLLVLFFQLREFCFDIAAAIL